MVDLALHGPLPQGAVDRRRDRPDERGQALVARQATGERDGLAHRGAQADPVPRGALGLNVPLVHVQPVAHVGVGIGRDGLDGGAGQRDRLVVGVDLLRRPGGGQAGAPGVGEVRRAGGQPVPRHLRLPPRALGQRLGQAQVHPGRP